MCEGREVNIQCKAFFTEPENFGSKIIELEFISASLFGRNLRYKNNNFDFKRTASHLFDLNYTLNFGSIGLEMGRLKCRQTKM